MTKPTAIITDVRYRMSLAVIRDLAESGVRVIAVEHSRKSAPLGFYSKYVDKTVFIEEENYLDELYELCKSECLDVRKESNQACGISKDNSAYSKTNDYKPLIKPALIPIGAVTLNLLADEETRKRFSEVAGIFIPTKENLELLNDKSKLHDYAESLGVPVPQVFVRDSNENIPAGELGNENTSASICNEKQIVFPVVVKPLCGEKYGITAADRYRIVRNSAELEKTIYFFKEKCGNEEPIVQQYIFGDGYGCSVIAKDGEIISSLCHKRIREYPISGGPSSCCEAVQSKELLEYTSCIVKALSFSGLAMFEYKQDKDGKFYLLECNPRVWGSYSLTRCAGSDISLKWFELSLAAGNPDTQSEGEKQRGDGTDSLGNSLESSKAVKSNGTNYNHVRMHYVITDLISGLCYLKSGRIDKWLDSIADIFRPSTKGGLLEFGDLKPSLKYVLGLINRQ